MTDFGKELLKHFNKMGMLVDLSHCGPKVVADVLKNTDKPVSMGHTCCKAIADNPRNKTDEQLKALKEVGGVVGITPWAPICWKRKENVPPTIDDYLDHVCHAVDLIGIDPVSYTHLHLRRGLTTYDGKLTLLETAEKLDLPYTDANELVQTF